MRRVAITGIGLLTPLGVGTEETWTALLGGRSAVAPIAAYDASSLRTQLGGEITGFDAKAAREYVNRRSLRTMTRYDVLTSVAVEIARRDADLEFGDDCAGRNALFTAAGKEISEPEHFQDVAVDVRDENGVVDMHRFGEEGMARVYPLFFIEGIQGASLFYVSEAYGLRGANTYFAGTAEAGLQAIGRAFRAIKRGEADHAIAGGGDAPVCWWNMAKIDSLELMTTRNDLGARACRPFDVERDGTVVGEGGAYLILEDLDGARARGARVYAEIVGFGSGTDIEHLFTPDPSGAGVVRAVQGALREAGSEYAALDYVAAHAGGTRAGDASEASALRALANGGAGPAVSSVKPATSHLVAAAGALNAAVAALAVHHSAAPATLNLEHVDPTCQGIEHITGSAREARISQALALARGLEGQNVALIVRAVEG